VSFYNNLTTYKLCGGWDPFHILNEISPLFQKKQISLPLSRPAHSLFRPGCVRPRAAVVAFGKRGGLCSAFFLSPLWMDVPEGRTCGNIQNLVGQKAAAVTRPATRRCVPGSTRCFVFVHGGPVRFLARRCNESNGRKKLSLPCRQGKEAPQRRFII
jgi:hypothetical protein